MLQNSYRGVIILSESEVKFMINIVLVEPEIPQNTGNIARTCSATGCSLHLVRPLGFTIDDKKLKRAGLDYWDELEIYYYENLDDFMRRHNGDELWFFSTKASKNHTEPHYGENAYLVFGKETKGLPEALLCDNAEKCVRIPMRENRRSLNLSNSVAIGVYEAFRQHGFSSLRTDGKRIDELLAGKTE